MLPATRPLAQASSYNAWRFLLGRDPVARIEDRGAAKKDERRKKRPRAGHALSDFAAGFPEWRGARHRGRSVRRAAGSRQWPPTMTHPKKPPITIRPRSWACAGITTEHLRTRTAFATAKNGIPRVPQPQPAKPTISSSWEAGSAAWRQRISIASAPAEALAFSSWTIMTTSGGTPSAMSFAPATACC